MADFDQSPTSGNLLNRSILRFIGYEVFYFQIHTPFPNLGKVFFLFARFLPGFE